MDILRLLLTWNGIVAAAAWMSWSAIAHTNGHREGRYPATCLAWRLDRGRTATYTILAGGCGGIARQIFDNASYPTDTIPGWVFACAGTLGALGCVRGYLAAKAMSGSVREHPAIIVEAATERDRFGDVLWVSYIAVGEAFANTGAAPGRKPPAVRAPADERGEERPILVRGEVTVGAPILFHDGKRWVQSEPAESGGITEIARRELL